ncbi:MAG: DUF2125 domain-containing protein [Parvibaculum sp.]
MSLFKKLSALHWPLLLPFLALLIAGVAYSIWWVTLGDRIEEELQAWQIEQATKGINVNWENVERGGFPYRLEMKLAKPSAELTNGRQPLTWSADTLNAQTLAYNLDHVIVDAPGAHTVRYTESRDGTEQEVTLNLLAETFWASLVFEEKDSERIAFDLAGLNLNRTMVMHEITRAAGEATADRLQLHARPTPRQQASTTAPETGTLSYDAALQVENITWQGMGDTLWTGSHLQSLEAQMRLSGIPADILKDEEKIAAKAFASGTKLSISEFKLIWGPVDMTGYGEMTLDAQGRPEGQFRTSVGNLPALVDALVTAEIMSRQSANLAFAGLTALSNLQGEESGRVRLPVAMKDGVLFLGPVAAGRLKPLL